MKVGDSVHTATTACHYCHIIIDGATVLNNEGAVLPKDNDVAVCFHCGSLGIYENNRLRKLTEDEFGDLMDSPNGDVVLAALRGWSDLRGRRQ